MTTPTPMTEDNAMTTDYETERRAEYIRGLRALADLLEQHPELQLPYDGSEAARIAVIPFSGREQREQLAAWAKALPGRKVKEPRDGYLDLLGSLHGLHVKVICHRNDVCERVVVGVDEITREVPDPAAPKVTVTEKVERIEWRCSPLLAEVPDAVH